MLHASRKIGYYTPFAVMPRRLSRHASSVLLVVRGIVRPDRVLRQIVRQIRLE